MNVIYGDWTAQEDRTDIVEVGIIDSFEIDSAGTIRVPEWYETTDSETVDALRDVDTIYITPCDERDELLRVYAVTDESG